MRGQQRRDDLRVRRAEQLHSLLAQLRVQLDGVDQVAVVGQRQLAPVAAAARAAVHRLRVLPLVRAGRRVADVPDRALAGQSAQLLLVKDL